MSRTDKAGVAQDVLWELGASFIDATAETAAPVVEAAISRIAQILDALSIGVWAIDPRSMTGRVTARWSVDEWTALEEGFLARPDPAVAEAVIAGGGLAIVDLDQVLSPEVCAERGWRHGYALVALIEEAPQENVVLVVATATNDWDERDLELIHGAVMLLRQFHTRVRVERHLHERLRLDDLTVTLAARFQAVSPENVEAAIEDGLRELKEALGLESIVLIDVVDDETIEIPTMIARSPLPPEFRRIPVPDISKIPGAGELSLREFVAEPRIADLTDLVEALMGPGMSDAFDLRSRPRTVAMVPASVARGDSLLAVTRLGEADWRPTEFDSISTLASLIAQTRARVSAERASSDLLDAQRALVTTGKVFLEANATSAPLAIREALERMAAHLGADLAVIARIEADRETVTITDSWSGNEALSVPEGTTLNRNAMPMIGEMIATDTSIRVREASEADAAPLRDSVDGKWTTIIAPIRGAGLPSAALNFIWSGGEVEQVDSAQELASAMADLIGQLQVRLRAEEQISRRLHLDAVLSTLAEGFLGASLDNAPAVIEQSMERLALETGLSGLALRAIEANKSIVEAVWAPKGQRRPMVGETREMDREFTSEILGEFQARQGESVYAGFVTKQWGPGLHAEVFPVVLGQRLESMLVAVNERPLGEHENEAVHSFSVMLGQLRARLGEERIAQDRLDAQRLLSACAGRLAEATSEELGDVVAEVMAQVAVFCDIEVLIDWSVDERQQRYVRSSIWMEQPIGVDRVPRVTSFNDASLLDEARTSGQTSLRTVDGPEVRGRCRLAIPRSGDAASSQHIMLAASSDALSEETTHLLESVSRMIHEVDARAAAQRYAEAAFQGAPIGVVLRDSDHNLITCNRAFVDFVGAESVESLTGTPPHFVYYDEYESVSWVTGPDEQLTAEAAFRGPGDSRVWGQMRRSVIEGERGEDFWLIHVEDVTERRRAEQLLRFQASHDELTGLANRRRLLDEIHRIENGPGSVAVLLLDLDRFKNINDSLGHDRGDELLVVIADRLRLAVRPGDLVARLGGDEFAVVLPGPVTVPEAEFVAERLMRLIGEPVTLGRQKIYPTASIGISVADEQTAVDDLIRRADTAMYRAKAQGRARSEAFDEELREAVHTRMETEAGLRGALRSNELTVHYQPEVSLDDGRLLGAEALIRWQHPKKGLLPAGAFIEVAEETGLVVEMGELVLAAACTEAASWPGGDDAPLIRVNLAAAQLQREETVDLVESVLEETGLAASRLCLEITESAVMRDVHRSENILHRLKALGLHLAVDDFGTGFSSLAYLKRFPVDALKIDRTFVSDLGHNTSEVAFVRSIISLADALGLAVVAEGVETAEQAEILVELGCHRAQGYFFAEPAPASALRERLVGPIESPGAA